MNNDNNVFNTQQINDVVNTTQNNLKTLQEKNEVLAKEIQNALFSAPTEIMNFFKQQQERSMDFNNQIMAAFQKTPLDYTIVTNIINEHSKNNFNSQLEVITKQNEKYQSLLTQYFSK